MGLINKDYFLSQLATNYGLSIYSRRPIKLLLESEPLQLDIHVSIDEAIKNAMHRRSDHIYDSLVITKGGEYYGTATIKDLLEISSRIELNRAKDANPLTNLPGNKMIEAELAQYNRQQCPFTAIYVDLDNFKAYNDTYGFAAGDQALMATAELLVKCSRQLCEQSFVGHIGGDDFILFFPETDALEACEYILNAFAVKSKSFYNREHQQQGYILAKNRQDELCRLPLMTISLAVLLVGATQNLSMNNLSTKAAVIKKRCKKQQKNNFIVETLM